MTAQELIKSALRVIGVIATGETPADAELQDGMEALNMLLDSWSNEQLMVYYETEDTHSLSAGTAKYTIGSGGDIDTVRPVKINRAFMRSGTIDTPINIIGEEQYRDIAIKTFSATSAWLYYNPGYALGEIYIYPAGGGTLYLYSLKPLTTFTALTDTVTLPPGYERTLKYNLAIELAPEYGKEATITIANRAQKAKDKLKAMNAAVHVQPVKLEILRLTRR